MTAGGSQEQEEPQEAGAMKKHGPAFGAVRGAGISSLRARDAHEGWVGRVPGGGGSK